LLGDDMVKAYGAVMGQVWQLVLAAAFPIVCLLLVLWLAHLEDTLVRDVRRSERKPEPPPILRIPAQARAREAQTPEVSRSAALSLGGSTNR
jgi:hypothetical protein